ncbi:MAG: hypothetical protein H6838_07400 [Planctomycetes bacterium]|nr:hypothetical protein [Planctomycetota bacterium]
MKSQRINAGLCVGGADSSFGELPSQSTERREFLDGLGYREACCVHHCGGNMMRTPYSLAGLLGASFHDALHGLTQPVYEMPVQALAERIQIIFGALGEALARAEAGDLDWIGLDALLGGVRRFNDEQSGADRAVGVLLCLVEPAPSVIVEAPLRRSLERCGVGVAFEDLWFRFTRLHIAAMRRVVRRYCVGPGAVVAAIEIVSEPDCTWLPDENRIERALRPDCDPLNKYVTERHLAQIPDRTAVSRPFRKDDHGGYREQEIDWGRFKLSDAPEVALLDYPWGAKFDKYVACCADLLDHASFAARDEAERGRAAVRIVSGAVANNLDYLIRLHRQNENVFRSFDGIGLRPYHWPRHDMHDQQFVSSVTTSGWQGATPRRFASDYCNRFDFLAEIAALCKRKTPKDSFGLAGKTLWLTEFGVPTKGAGTHVGAGTRQLRNLFVYRRGEAPPSGVHAIVWEDKWDRFLEQVTPQFLADNCVETMLLHSMRPTCSGDTGDDGRSDFALFEADCETPRMERATFRRLLARLGELTGRMPDVDWFAQQTRVNGIAGQRTGAPLSDWTAVDPSWIPEAPGMTQIDELRYLYWACASTFEGRGRVVELGSFLGRTTAALAAGLAASAHPDVRVVSIDSHIWDPWTFEHYGEFAIACLSPDQRRRLPAEAISPSAGGSFRPLFDIYTEAVQRNVEGLSLNLDDCDWTGESIEILFVDAAKSWATLDNIVEQFFPCLVDGATVIHQDYKHFFTYWLHPVTERMIEDGLLTPTVDVRGTSTQGYLYRKPEKLDLGRYLRAAFETDEVDRLLERSRSRYALPEAITVAGAQVHHYLDTGRRADAARLFAATITAGGFRDDYGLTDLFSLMADRFEPLWDRVVAGRRSRVRRVGNSGVVLEVERVGKQGVVELTMESEPGASFVVHVGPHEDAAGSGACAAPISVRVAVAGGRAPSFERELAVAAGVLCPVAAPLHGGRATVRIEASAPILLRAPMILRPVG